MAQLQLLLVVLGALLCTTAGAAGLIRIGQQTAPVVIQHTGTIAVEIVNGHLMYTPRGRRSEEIGQ